MTDSISDAESIPPAYTLIWPIVRALRELGGSGRNAEINDRVARLQGFTEAQQQRPGPQNEPQIAYRLGWARTHAKNLGLLVNAGRGVWALTKAGQEIEEHEVATRRRAADRGYVWIDDGRVGVGGGQTAVELATGGQMLSESSGAAPDGGRVDGDGGQPAGALAALARMVPESGAAPDGGDTAPDDGEPDGEGWRDTALAVLRAMDASAFERLAQRLLRQAGFVNVVVSGRTGDGGIDGTGVYRMSLVSFPVFFQCKRYAGTVGSPEVRDFRGAMIGRGDKGLLITTGTFTSSARRESTRDGAPPLDLIDGAELVELLREHKLGISTELVERVTVHPEFFADL